MKIAAWNCCWKFDETKFRPFAELAPDLAVIAECSSQRPARMAPESQWEWIGPKNHCLAVAAFGDYSIQRVDVPELPGFVLPVRVDGPERAFNLVAVWAQGKGPCGYVRGLDEAFAKLGAFISSGPTIIAGDFNSNALWNKKCGRINHSTIVRRLSDLGLVSAYHKFFRQEHGSEDRPTFHRYWDLGKPYHLDYVFVPDRARIRAVTVGDATIWIEHSDHAPLSVELEL